MIGLEDFTGLLKFSATWCQPCKRIAPIVKEVAQEGNLTLLNLDIDKNPKTTRAAGVRSVPTVILMRDGKIVDHLVGVHNKAGYENLIKKL